MEDFKIDVISLKRHGAKEWQYKDCAIARVEIAVLDYLKDQGWSGYFTEQYDFEEITKKLYYQNHELLNIIIKEIEKELYSNIDDLYQIIPFLKKIDLIQKKEKEKLSIFLQFLDQ